MINKSIWLKNIKEKSFPKLNENIKTDVLIIGGGITGLSTAYFLKDSNKKITLVEQNKIGHGITSKTTGKLTYLQGTVYQKLENIYGIDIAKKYLNSQKYAIDLVKEIIIQNNIKCDYQSNSSYVFTNSSKSKINNEIKALDKMNQPYKIRRELPIAFPCKYAVRTENSAVFHPIKYLMQLKEIIINNNSNNMIYENTMIKHLEKISDGYIAYTDKYQIEAKKVVLACHYPFFLKPGFLPLRTYLKKAYVTAAVVDDVKRFNAISEDKEVHSIRYHSDNKNYIIYSSESRSLGNNMDNEKHYKDLFWKTSSNISDKIKYYWFNYDIMTSDYMPLIGYYEKNNSNLLIGTGYNSWGMTNGTIAGKIISDLIMNKKNEYIDLFNPNRSTNILKIFNVINYNIKTSTSFVLSKLKCDYNFYPSNVKIVNKNGIKYGIYTDEDNKEHIVYNTCPHMKCGLIFNNVDKTWDCPCHGSRFDINGKVIKGPSVYSIKVK